MADGGFLDLVERSGSDSPPDGATRILRKSGAVWQQTSNGVLVPLGTAAGTTLRTLHVRPATGSDLNDGSSSGTALKTMAQAAAMSNGLFLTDPTQPLVIFLYDDMAASDSAFFNVRGVGGFPTNTPNSPAGFDSWLTIIGVPSVQYSGVLTSPTSITCPSANRFQFTDAIVPGGSWTASGFLGPQYIFRRTNGTVCRWFGAKDQGSTVLQTSQPNNTTGVYPSLSANDTYNVEKMPKLHNVGVSAMENPECGVQFSLCNIDTAALGVRADWAVYSYCSFSSLQFIQGQFFNCSFPAGMRFGSVSIAPAAGQIVSGLFRGNGDATFRYGMWLLSDENGGYITFMNTRLIADVQGQGARLIGQFYDNTGRDCTLNAQNSHLNAINIGGSGCNQTINTAPFAGGLFSYANLPSAATITSAGNPWSTHGVAGAAPAFNSTNQCGQVAE